MQVVLVMFRSDGERRSFSITRDVTVIGRRQDCDFRIPLGDVSRKHCRLIKDAGAGTLKIEDLGSSNGTFRNGERVQEAELQPGDTLQIGPVVFVLQIDGVPADDELQPVTAGAAPAPAEEEEIQPLAESNGEDAAASHLEPAGAASENGEPATDAAFDPMSILAGVEDSGSAQVIEDSAIGEDVLAEL